MSLLSLVGALSGCSDAADAPARGVSTAGVAGSGGRETVPAAGEFAGVSGSGGTLEATGGFAGASGSGGTLEAAGGFAGASGSGGTLEARGGFAGASGSGGTLEATGGSAGASGSGGTLEARGGSAGASGSGGTLEARGGFAGASGSGNTTIGGPCASTSGRAGTIVEGPVGCMVDDAFCEELEGGQYCTGWEPFICPPGQVRTGWTTCGEPEGGTGDPGGLWADEDAVDCNSEAALISRGSFCYMPLHCFCEQYHCEPGFGPFGDENPEEYRIAVYARCERTLYYAFSENPGITHVVDTSTGEVVGASYVDDGLCEQTFAGQWQIDRSCEVTGCSGTYASWDGEQCVVAD